MSDKNITINITTGTFLRAVIIALLVFFLYVIRDVVAIVLFSVVIASGVEPATQWFQKKKLPRTISVILVYLLAFLVFAFVFYLVIPPIFEELSSLIEAMPGYLDKSFESRQVSSLLPQLPTSISQLVVGFAQELRSFIETIAAGLFAATSIIFGGALSFIMIIVLSFYLSVQEKGIESFLRLVTPRNYETYIIDLWFRARQKIGGWMKGQVLLGIMVGILVFLGLTIMRVKYALTFALLAAVFEIIPIFGPILAAIPAVGVAFLESPSLALGVAILYFVIQQFENHLIYPLVVKKVIGINPIVTILALIVGAKLGGFLGLLLAVPVSTVLLELLNDLGEEKKEYRKHHEEILYHYSY